MKTTLCKMRFPVSGLLILAILTACVPASNPLPTPTPASPPAQTPQSTEMPLPAWVTDFSEPILLAIQDRPPDYQDDFSKTSTSWYFETAPVLDRGNIEIANGVLMMSTDPGQFAYASHARMILHNFLLRVDVRFLELDVQKGINLVWRGDDKGGGEVFQLGNEGSWSLTCYFAECPVFASGSLSVDLTEPVTITIVSKGTEFAVYLNNIPLAYHNDIGRPPASSIRLELAVNPENEGTSAIAYDNLSIWDLDPVFPPPPAPWVTDFSDPILLAIQDRPPDFQDDFSSDANGWLIKAETPLDRGSVEIANGGMNLSLGQGGFADHYSTSFRDFVVQVDVDFLVLNMPSAARLEWLRYEVYDSTLIRQGFEIDSYGSWTLWSCPLEAPGTPPECQEGLPSGSASVDLSEPVTVTLISKGTELAVYLNGTPLTYYTYFGQPSASHVRLSSYDNSENQDHMGIVFDNFKIWELQSVFPPDPPDPALGIGSNWERPVDGMVMMYVPEGEFQMGSSIGGPDEQPVHAVYLDAFWIDQTEVTNAMFAKFLNEMGNQTEENLYFLAPDHYAAIWYNPETQLGREKGRVFLMPDGITWQPESGYAEHPATSMNWYGAQAYCEWAGGRLPTEAEWEKAARGGLEGRLYPWGDEPPVCTLGASNGAWIGPFCHPKTLPPVGRYAPNGYGLYDMVGSVGEWTADWFSRTDYTYYAGSPYRNPLGPRHPSDKQNMAIHSSDAAMGDLDMVRIAYRGTGNPWGYKGGIRCVRSP